MPINFPDGTRAGIAADSAGNIGADGMATSVVKVAALDATSSQLAIGRGFLYDIGLRNTTGTTAFPTFYDVAAAASVVFGTTVPEHIEPSVATAAIGSRQFSRGIPFKNGLFAAAGASINTTGAVGAGLTGVFVIGQ